MVKFRSPNLYTITVITKIRKGFLKKKERVKGLFLWLCHQVKSNYTKNEPCKRDCSWMISFFNYLDFGYCKYGIFFQLVLKMAVHAAPTREKICEVNNFWYFFKKSCFILMFFQEGLASWQSRRQKSKNFLLSCLAETLT